MVARVRKSLLDITPPTPAATSALADSCGAETEFCDERGGPLIANATAAVTTVIAANIKTFFIVSLRRQTANIYA